jgi:hypothetical protein
MQGFPQPEKPTRGFEPRTPSLRVMTLTSENPCNLGAAATEPRLEPAVNPLLQAPMGETRQVIGECRTRSSAFKRQRAGAHQCEPRSFTLALTRRMGSTARGASIREQRRSTATGRASPASASRSCAGPRAVTRTTATSQNRRPARNTQRGVPHPLGRARRALPRRRSQALPPSRGRRAQPELQPGDLAADHGLTIFTYTRRARFAL